jgi:hypothetical protein
MVSAIRSAAHYSGARVAIHLSVGIGCHVVNHGSHHAAHHAPHQAVHHTEYARERGHGRQSQVGVHSWGLLRCRLWSCSPRPLCSVLIHICNGCTKQSTRARSSGQRRICSPNPYRQALPLLALHCLWARFRYGSDAHSPVARYRTGCGGPRSPADSFFRREHSDVGMHGFVRSHRRLSDTWLMAGGTPKGPLSI